MVSLTERLNFRAAALRKSGQSGSVLAVGGFCLPRLVFELPAALFRVGQLIEFGAQAIPELRKMIRLDPVFARNRLH